MGEIGAQERFALGRDILDALAEGCQVIGFDWTYLYVNDALVAYAGRTREELLGRTMMECYPGIEATEMFDALRRCMAERRHHQMLNEFRFPDGSTGWFELRFVPVPAGMCILSSDITQRRRAQLTLERSERTLSDLLAALPDAVVVVGDDGVIVLANHEAERTFGHARLEGLRIEALVPDASKDGLADLCRAAGASARRGTVASPLRAVRSDGAEFSVDVSVGRVMRDGAWVTVCAVRDITERLRLEERLRQTQKLEALGALAGGVAHDFNNILSVILSYTSLHLASGQPGDTLHEDLEQIHAAGLRAADLTRQLLAFGRKQILQPRLVDLNQIVRRVERMLGRMLGEDVELVVRLSSQPGVMRVDPAQMEQLIVNLSLNARDAMPRGGTLTIETSDVVLTDEYAAERSGVAAGPHVVLSVTDTGAGMDESTKARMFEPFFTTKTRGQGTGLGLATVFGTVEQSGGHITVASELGKGTTLKVYFQRLAGKLDEGATDPKAATEEPLGGTETILVVEDDPRVREVVVMILRRLGYDVLEAASGVEALALSEARGSGIRLLITDVVMPRMSGRQLAELVQAVRPDIAVLYMSGYTDDAIVNHGVLDPSVDFLHKPITPDALARKVREVLDR